MKIRIAIIGLLLIAWPATASQIIPPLFVVKWVIRAVQEEDRREGVQTFFEFDAGQHASLTPLTREQQLQLLRDLPLERLEFDRDESAIEEDDRFVVKLVAPVQLDLEMRRVELTEEFGPQWRYTILAVRESESTAAGRCPIGGDPVHWIADYCMAKLETDDEIAASDCIADELTYRPAEDGAARRHYKRALCELAVTRGTRNGTVASCLADPGFMGSTVAHGGVGN